MEIRNLVTLSGSRKRRIFPALAEQLGYSQSAVTMQIKQLESELHVQLFERIGKQVKLTQAGEPGCCPYALEILGAVRQAEKPSRANPRRSPASCGSAPANPLSSACCRPCSPS